MSTDLLHSAQANGSEGGMNIAALQSLLCMCDDVCVFAGCLDSLGSGGAHQSALLDVCLLLYNDVSVKYHMFISMLSF